MGILDLPKGLISRLPIIGGSGDSNDDDDARSKPVAEAPETEPEEVEAEPDAVEEDEPDAVEEDEPSEEPEDDPDSTEDQPDAAPDASDDSEDISDTTAPSIGPNTVIEKDTPEERLARHEQSDTDAMGLDKRREVIGGNYGASFGKQLTRWALVVLIVAAGAFGAKLLVDDLDKPDAKVADKAPWAGNNEQPRPLE